MSPKTDAEIVAEVNDLARTMLGLMDTGYTVPAGFKFYADHSGERLAIRATKAWNAAVTVYEQITGTEVHDALQTVLEEQPIKDEDRRLYEESRKGVSGRPSWDALDPRDPYDMGMRAVAMERAEQALRPTPSASREVTAP
jgi:hypothetical protein